jgi:thymidylate synthase (FAD)
MRHWHSTPFEMCEIKLHVKLPVFVARQWIRHRTANVNEYSARYSILDREFYIPAPEHVAAQSTVNNQGRGETLQGDGGRAGAGDAQGRCGRAYDNYEAMMSQDGQQGLARELARMNLPANIYTQWYWKTDLHNLFHFLRLRADAHAQYEIRVYAEAICGDGAPTGCRRPMGVRGLPDGRRAAVGEGGRGVAAPAGRGGRDAGDVGDEQGGMAGV